MSQNIRKIIEEYTGAQQKIEKGVMRARLTCNHQNNSRDNALRPFTNKNDPSKQCFRCEKCGALIPPVAPTEDAVNKAVETLEVASHYMRLISDPTSEKGKDKCEFLANTMMDVIKFSKAYIQEKHNQEAKAKKKNKAKSGNHSIAQVDI